MYDGVEYDYEELVELVINDSEQLTEESYGDEEWADQESEDTFYEEMWEVISNTQASLIGECEEIIKENQSE